MWKAGGTKIEHTRDRYIVYMCVHRNPRKSDNLGKTLRNQKISTVVLQKMKRCNEKRTLMYFWSDRFETNRTCSLNIRVHVLFVSKRSDQKNKSFSFSLHRKCVATNLETWVTLLKKMTKSRLSDRLCEPVM